MLDKEFQYFVQHQDELVSQYNWKYIFIKDQQIIGAYTTEIEAYTESSKKHKLGTFLIQLCVPCKDIYKQTFHSQAKDRTRKE